MRTQPCEKCGTRHRPSRHHNLPKCFFGGYGGITWLCVYCHRDIEKIILDTEVKASGSNLRQRFKLDKEVYYEILNRFIDNRPALNP